MSGAIEDVARKWAAVQPLVDSFISLLIPDYHDAQDVLQEVAAAVLSHDPSRGVPESFNAWVIGIARNKAMDAHRRRSNSKMVFDSEALQLLAEAHDQARDEQGPLHDAMEHCLKRLASKARQLVEMRYQDNLKPGEIARTLGSSITAINVALQPRPRGIAPVHRVEARVGWIVMKDPMELLDKHFDGLLTEAEAEELCQWVKKDPRNARAVTRATMIHQRLRQIMRGRQLLEEAASLGSSLDDAMILPAITLESETRKQKPRNPPPTRLRRCKSRRQRPIRAAATGDWRRLSRCPC